MPLISVIMPVYNSEKYLANAIDSVLAQTLEDFELILIDDGSTDKSSKICDEYSIIDYRVKVIHKENGGICSARNAGLDKATGQYLAFCDNDDRYLPGLLKDNYDLALEYNADIVRFKRLLIKLSDDGKREVSTNPPFQFCVLRDEEIWKNYNQIKAAYTAVWAGLYLRKFIESNHIRFDDRMRYSAEDRYFNLQVYCHCKCVVLNPKIYYYWIMRYSHSTTGKFNYNFIKTMKYCAKKEYGLYNNFNVDNYLPNYWEKIMLDYLSEIFRYMDRKVCDLNLIQKLNVLKNLRNQRAFSINFRMSRLKKIYKNDKFEGLMWYCFFRKHYIFFYYLLKKITK